MKPLTNENTLGASGIPVKDTFWVMDSSKIQRFMNCPRGFFFNHILGWQSTKPNIHLVFGSAWHEAMEHLMLNGSDVKSVQAAFERFMKVYEKDFQSDPFHTEHRSKNPEMALQGLADYVAAYPIDPQYTVYTEVAGTAEIRPGRDIHFKMDTIRKHPPHHEEAGKYYSLEHKTTSRNSGTWRNKWSYKFQVGTYLHALHSWVGNAAEVDGVTINGSIFRTKDTEHLRIPVRKTGIQMSEWMWEANYWIDQYIHEMEKLAETKPSDKVMVAFPRNTESCGKFGCDFLGLCNAMPNPCQRTSPPNGYKRDFWDPREREKTAKKVMHLTGGDDD